MFRPIHCARRLGSDQEDLQAGQSSESRAPLRTFRGMGGWRHYLAALLLVLALPAQAANFAPTDAVSLIADINAANGNNEADIIDLGGITITLTAVDNATDGNNGLPSIVADGGNSLTIRNGTIQRTLGAAEPFFRLLHVANGADLRLDNLTLSGGRIEAEQARGGGIYLNGGTLSITDSQIHNHVAFGVDGGFFGFSSASGGAIYSTGGTLNIRDSSLIDNSALGGSAEGGAISSTSNTQLTISGSSFTGNEAGVGGALRIFGGNTQISNSTFSGNTAANAGAIHVRGPVTLLNSTLTANTATLSGGGLFIESGGNLTLINSIVAGNIGSDPDCRNSSGIVSSASFNLIGVGDAAPFGACGFTDGVNNNQVGTAASPLNPQLAPLSDNGGPTRTHALCTGASEPVSACTGVSLAIDAGDNATCAAAPVNNLDQRGVPRPIAAVCDVGAFEAGAMFDFGDAPDPTYPTLLASNGAAHVIDATGPHLGVLAPDAESDGQQSADASGDGPEDDGFSPTTLTIGTTKMATVTVSNAAGARGNAWIDLNQDGDWDDAGEQLANDLDASAGSYTFNVTLSPDTPAGTYLARVRVCSTAGNCNSPRGIATDGEVEDYAITVNAAPAGGGGSSSSGGGSSDNGDRSWWNPFGIGALDPFTLVLLAALGLYGLRRRMGD